MNQLFNFKNKHYYISSSIITTTKLDTVQARISHFDLMDGLGSKNSGYLINFGDDDNGDPIFKLIAWNMVLKGGITCMQSCSERNEFSNLATAFNNRKKPT